MVEFNTNSEKSSNRDSTMKTPGLCGLINLGNTCYMNSILQCLSNCLPLTEYFLKKRHLQDINIKNPLGMNGEIAKAFGDLIQNMWSGQELCLKPSQFKLSVGRFNSQFRGWSQHDAQELLTFLLDGLNEDLNRVVKKPDADENSEPPKDGQGASNSWENHILRNDSIIVDTFHGLLKSRVICPQCERLSVTFDPFCTLSLPLPGDKTRFITIHFIPYEPSSIGSTFQVTFPKKGLIKDIICEVAMKTRINPKMLIPADVTDYHIHRIYTPGENIEIIRNRKELFVYEISEMANDPGFTLVPVCFWNLESNKMFNVSFKYGFGVPLLLSFSKSDLGEGKIGFCIIEHLRKRHFNLSITDHNVPEIYIIDLTNKLQAQPTKLEFLQNGRCVSDILNLLESSKSEKVFVSKMLLVNVLLTDDETFSNEETSVPSGSGNSVQQENRTLTIYNCLELFTSFEKLCTDNAWYCPTCKEHQRATKKFDIWMTPKILILHLKRFSCHGTKLETPVDFPLTDLDMSPYISNPGHTMLRYNLIGVVNHFGSLTGGHYTACCKNFSSGTWYSFNDHHVAPIDPKRIVSSSAYLLFYIRSDSPQT